MTIDQKIALWSSSIFDAQTQKEVHNLKQKPAALHDAFYTELRFGTGGMRGIMGVGTNRINKYTLGRCTQGLANFLNEKNWADRRIYELLRYKFRLFDGVFGASDDVLGRISDIYPAEASENDKLH